MTEIVIITSDIQTPADAVTAVRADAAAAMTGSDDSGIRIISAESEEAKKLCPSLITEDDAFELFGSEEDRSLMNIWHRKRNREFEGLPVRTASIWNDEYDRLTDSVRDAAERYGRIMTPVVLAGGRIISSGRAAKPCELEKCVAEIMEN